MPLPEPVQPHREKRLLGQRHYLAADAAEGTREAPRAQRDDVGDADGKGAVDLGGLGQVGDVAGGDVAHDPAARRGQEADDRLHEGRLAGAVGTDHGRQAAGLEAPVDVAQGGPAVVGDAEMADGDAAPAHGTPHGPGDRQPEQGQYDGDDSDAGHRRLRQNRPIANDHERSARKVHDPGGAGWQAAR